MKISASVHFVSRTCDECGKKYLFRYNWKRVALGSPLVKCRHCEAISITRSRTEWCTYPYQWQMWIAPAVICILPGFIGEQPEEAVFNVPKALTGMCIGLIILGVNLIRIKKRMKDPVYVQKLFEYGVISDFQRDYFLNRI